MIYALAGIVKKLTAAILRRWQTRWGYAWVVLFMAWNAAANYQARQNWQRAGGASK